MWVESGEGSSFHFVVPLAAADEPQPEDAALEIATATDSPRHLRVLVVDDNPANRLLAARILEKRGHTVLHATNGREALEMIQQEPIQLVLMDAQMPEMDGLEATAAIRAWERETTQHLPIIAVTAAAMKGDRERLLAGGMDGYISKPLKSQDLVRLVETLGIEHADGLPECPCIAASSRDFTAALARLEGDEEILREQMQLFLADGPALLTQIREAIAANDADSLQIAAHRLKGFAASFDDPTVVDLARQLERKGRDGDLLSAQALGDRLHEAMADLQMAMQVYLRRSGRV
jgi:CheY-like chemotaxis protein